MNTFLHLINTWIIVGCTLSFTASAQTTQYEEVTVKSSRRTAEGKNVTVSVIQEWATTQPKAVFLVIPSVAVSEKETTASAHKFVPNEPNYFPMNRNRESMVQSGMALVWMGWPSLAELGISGTSHPDFQRDIASVVEHTRQRWPKVPLVLVGTYGGASTGLNYVLDRPTSVDGFLAISPHWYRERNERVESLKNLKTLVLHDSSGECLNGSLPEVIEISQRASFVRIPVHTRQRLEIGRCTSPSAHWLRQADSQWTQTLGDWLDFKPSPAVLGVAVTAMTISERVLMVKTKSGQIEISIFSPVGKGPFPLVVFNHGDVEMAHPSVKYKERFRDPVVTATFLRWGFAVAVPARPGVGRSDGQYRYTQYAINDGDPSYKARQHSEAVRATLEGLKDQADLDMNQVVLAGQSAGGDTVMYMSTLEIPGVRGVINFSGGRSNHAQGENPAFENRMMVRGWGDLGKEAKVPAMLVFAENDSRYSPNTIRKAAQAYKDAGGDAQLLLLPPTRMDGHFVYQLPALWQTAVKRFAIGLKLSNSDALAQTDNAIATPQSLANAKTHPELFDLALLPVQSESCKDLYLRFLNAPLPRFFAASATGRGCGFSDGDNATEARALEFCQRRGTQCVAYAKDFELLTAGPERSGKQ